MDLLGAGFGSSKLLGTGCGSSTERLGLSWEYGQPGGFELSWGFGQSVGFGLSSGFENQDNLNNLEEILVPDFLNISRVSDQSNDLSMSQDDLSESGWFKYSEGVKCSRGFENPSCLRAIKSRKEGAGWNKFSKRALKDAGNQKQLN